MLRKCNGKDVTIAISSEYKPASIVCFLDLFSKNKIEFIC